MQEPCTTLIGCAESVPARKYKITRNPVKGALLISEVFWPISDPIFTQIITNYSVSNILNVLNLLDEIKLKSLKSFIYFSLQDLD
jgi:hypothetical protein